MQKSKIFQYGKIINELKPLKRIVTLSVMINEELSKHKIEIYINASTIEDEKVPLSRMFIGSFSDVVYLNKTYHGAFVRDVLLNVKTEVNELSKFSDMEKEGILQLINECSKESYDLK